MTDDPHDRIEISHAASAFPGFSHRYLAGSAVLDRRLVWSDLPADHIGILALSVGMSVVNATYFIVMHARTGQTVGKRICGVRVVRERDEQQITWKQSVLREIPLLILMAGFTVLDVLLFVWGEDRAPLAVMTGYVVIERLNWGWALIDAGCTLFNPKRRSLHDYIGQTVVVRID